MKSLAFTKAESPGLARMMADSKGCPFRRFLVPVPLHAVLEVRCMRITLAFP